MGLKEFNEYVASQTGGKGAEITRDPNTGKTTTNKTPGSLDEYIHNQSQIAAGEAMWDRGEQYQGVGSHPVTTPSTQPALRAPGLSMVENALGNPNGTVYDQVMNGRPGYTPPAETTPNTGGNGIIGGGVAVSPTPGTPSTPSTPSPSVPTPSVPSVPSGGGISYQPSTLPTATDKSDYLNELYAQKQAAELAALERAYQQQIAALEQEAAKLPQIYYEAGRQVTGNNARERQAMQEMMVASGLNTGASGQAALAQNAVYQGNMAAVSQAEAQALADVEADRTALAMDYQNQIKEAILNNEADRALALYNEMIRVDESIVDTALKQAQLNAQAYQYQQEAERYEREWAQKQADRELAALEERAATMAALGDFSLFKALGYTDAEIAALTNAWQTENGVNTGSVVTSGGNGVNNGGMSNAQVAAIQLQLGVPADGLWGPKTTAAAGMTAAEWLATYGAGSGGTGSAGVLTQTIK